MQKILLYNRSTVTRETIRVYLKKKYYIISISKPEKIFELLKHHQFSLVIIGVQPGEQVKEQKLFQYLKSNHPLLPVFLVTSTHEEMEKFQELYPNINGGAVPPLDSDSLLEAVSKILDKVQTVTPGHIGEIPVFLYYDSEGNVSHETEKLIKNIPGTGLPVLLIGEPGTKAVAIPRYFHHTFKNQSPYIHVHCQGISETEFMEKIKSFPMDKVTGTSNGTLFLNGVDNLSPKNQQILLDWLYNFDPGTGSVNKQQALNVFLSSTPDFFHSVDTGFFNRELFYRISGITIHLAPVKALENHVTNFFGSFLQSKASQLKLPTVNLDEESKDFIKLYSWPWNIVEMEWVIHHILMGSLKTPFTVNDLISLTANFHVVKSTGIPSESAIPESTPDVPTPRFKEQTRIDSLLLEIVHNIKNPLVAIKTFAQLLPEKYEDLEFRERFAKIVNEDINRIDSYLSEITFHVNLGEPASNQVNLNQLISEIKPNFESISKVNKIELVTKTNKKQSFNIKSDLKMLRYAMNNIVQQAFADLDPGGKIEISLEKSLDESKIENCQVIFAISGTQERKQSFASISQNESYNETSLKLLLAERVFQKLGIVLEQHVDSDEKTSIILRFP